jgi:hypothetical protein
MRDASSLPPTARKYSPSGVDDHHRARYPEERRVEQGAELRRDAEDRVAAGVDQGRRAVERQRAERHDEGLEPAVGHERAVEHAGHHAEEEGDRDRDRDRRTGGHHHRRGHRRDGRRRADRQVDAAGDDDERHAERDAGVDRGLLEDVEEVALGQEVRAEEGEDHHDREEA